MLSGSWKKLLKQPTVSNDVDEETWLENIKDGRFEYLPDGVEVEAPKVPDNILNGGLK